MTCMNLSNGKTMLHKNEWNAKQIVWPCNFILIIAQSTDTVSLAHVIKLPTLPVYE